MFPLSWVPFEIEIYRHLMDGDILAGLSANGLDRLGFSGKLLAKG